MFNNTTQVTNEIYLDGYQSKGHTNIVVSILNIMGRQVILPKSCRAIMGENTSDKK